MSQLNISEKDIEYEKYILLKDIESKNQMNNYRNTTHETWIYDSSEQYRPPSQPVLGVEVQDNVVFLTIANYDETYDTFTYKKIATVCVDVKTLLHAINS